MAGFHALSVRKPQGFHRDQSCWSYRRRTAHRCNCGSRRPSPHRILLRSDNSDLVGTAYGCSAGGSVSLWRGCNGTDHCTPRRWASMRLGLRIATVLALAAALFIPFSATYPPGYPQADASGILSEPAVTYWSFVSEAFFFALISAAAAIGLCFRMSPRLRIAVVFCSLLSGSLALFGLLEWYAYFAPLSAPNVLQFTLGFWLFATGAALVAWQTLEALSSAAEKSRTAVLIVPAVFGFQIPVILLPPPSQVGDQLFAQAGTLWADLQQTFVKASLPGFAMGCGLGFFVAVLTDRVPFLQRGLLPLGNLAGAVPIVGIAPIMVMWFGFDWPSKAAVVVIMTFFPMLINAIAGLSAADQMQRDLMRSYGAGYWQTLIKLRLPAALPFIFNALKINSTLALIGAIVAEFFGSHTVGLGFRISTEAAKMNMALVWAAIVVAAVTGSLAYALLVQLERRFAFWHPAIRAA